MISTFSKDRLKTILSSQWIKIPILALIAGSVFVARNSIWSEPSSTELFYWIVGVSVITSILNKNWPESFYIFESSQYPSLYSNKGTGSDIVKIGRNRFKITFKKPMRCVPTLTISKIETPEICYKHSPPAKIISWNKRIIVIDFSDINSEILGFHFVADAGVFGPESIFGKVFENY